jgi:starch-binding outer membrane protein, SusD/RagB family
MGTSHEGRRGRGALWGALLLMAPLAACEGLLEVEAPSQVLAEDLENPANARLLVDGLVADFECALGHYILVGGLLGTELRDSQQTAAQWDYDRRTLVPDGGWYATSTCDDRMGAYTPLSTARWAADNALEKLEGWSDAEVANRVRLIATAAAYSGYAHVLMGEGFCTAAFDGGPELTRQQVFQRAEQRFTRAIEAAGQAGVSDLLNMARVGRARARLNLGQGAAAASDAEQVPPAFVFNARYNAASGRSSNNVFVQNQRNRFVTVEAPFHNLTWAGVPDPRVTLVNTGTRGPDQQSVIWNAMKYPTDASPIRVARGTEALLIRAEVAGGQTAVGIINQLHTAAGIPPFQSNDPAAIREQIILERSREFFLEGHHLGDLIRYDRPLVPAPGTPWHNGAVYGDTRCMPLPDVERFNNPTLQGG